MSAADDLSDGTGLIAPLILCEGSRHRPELTNLVLELAQSSAGLRRSLPESLLSSLATFVGRMNCYSRNLIEGHDIHPVDSERALGGEYSKDEKKRDLQLEAMAYISVQQWIDEGGPRGRAIAADFVREIHNRLCEALTDELLWVEDLATQERIRVIPGGLRTRDVAVGDHGVIAAPAGPRFLERFGEAYGRLGRTETILAAARPITACWGFTRSSMATTASRD